MFKGRLEITSKESGEVWGILKLPAEKKVTKLMNLRNSLENENPNYFFYLTIEEVKNE